MSRMPGATWDGEHSPRKPMERYDIVCIHTIVGRAPAHAAHLSTFMDGRPPHQSRDTAYQSAANLDGNHRVLAIENEDHGGNDVHRWPALTDSQVEDCARFLAFAHKEHGVPLQLCPDSRPGSRGLAYHRQGCDGNFGPGSGFAYPGRVDGGERWTSHYGKVCPTDARIAQLPTILERAKALVSADEGLDMDEKQLRQIIREELADAIGDLDDTKIDNPIEGQKVRRAPLGRILFAIRASVQRTEGRVKAIEDQLKGRAK